MKDSFGREIDYLRLSVTDRCNLRCVYCMGEEGVEWKPHCEMLSFEELERLCFLFSELGIKKIKITGGEPLVKKGVVPFIARVRHIPGITDVTLTTNGVLLEYYLDELAEAGVSSVNVSLDSLDRRTFQRLSGRDEFDRVYGAIQAAVRKNFRVKINAVLLRGLNDAGIEDFALFARDNEVSVRFIELMPLGTVSAYEMVPTGEVLEKISRVIKGLTPVSEPQGNGPAVYYAAPDMKGKIAFISAMSSCFCATCTRLRLDSLGRLKPCLSSGLSRDLKALVRGGADNGALKEAIRETARLKPHAHIFADRTNAALRDTAMSKIGG
ncbi:MAG: GTP 3',8-cyclase MoaA [Spirochaetaceae bacterium]|nr:GTP 3',8-cyclase MoaA [Spirochaetaceae bacterium]